MTLPFFAQESQLMPGSTLSPLLNIRIVLGVSAVGGFETLHTRRSPSEVCEASISDLCLDEDACHARFTIGDGARWVAMVCRIVKEGIKLAMRMDPFL